MIDMVILDRYVHDHGDEDPERPRRAEEIGDFIVEFARENKHGKPMVIALNAHANDPGSAAAAARLWVKYARAGLPTYVSQLSASRALSRFAGYHEYLARTRGGEE